jgi:hypothetical protein
VDDDGVVGSAMPGSQLRPRRSSQGDLECIESTDLMVAGLGAWDWVSTTKADACLRKCCARTRRGFVVCRFDTSKAFAVFDVPMIPLFDSIFVFSSLRPCLEPKS